MSDELVLQLDPPYAGSAVSPTVDITETTTDVTVTITDFRGEHSYSVEKTDQAIADAEAAASSANNAATQAIAIANQAASGAAATASAAAERADTAAGGANAAAQSANSAATSASQTASYANAAATNADAKAALADSKATLANTAATTANNAAQAANNAADVAIEAAETITDGYYPRMLAGAAEALMGEADTATFAERVSSHDGVARIESIQGNTVVFNQIMASGFARWSAIGGTASIVDSVASFTASESGARYQHQLSTAIAEHKYISLISIRGDTGGSSLRFAINNVITSVTTTTAWQRVGVIGSSNNAGNFYYPRIYDDSAIETLQFRDPQLFDLTRMFGAGNEPATVEEFEAMFPDDYYPYNAGELLSVNIEGVNDREIPVSTYFPDGMRSAGSIHDELTATKAVKRVGVVDLGALNWVYNASLTRFNATTTIRNAKAPNYTNLLCSALTADSSPVSGQNRDNTICLYNNGVIFVVAKNYTDPAAFKAAMSGVLLYYELATPTETPIDPPLQMSYRAAIGGTESIIASEISAPPTLAVRYSKDAGQILDILAMTIAPVETATASANYAIGDYLIYAHQLYRVTSAIATGEAITPGSNCVACTVMGEVVRLTA